MKTQIPSLKVNYLLNVTIQIFNVLYPLLTLPYVTRILGAEYLGKVNFALAFVQYFITFANFGIGSYAIREISKVRDKPEELNRVFSELFSMLFFSTLLFSTLYLLSFFLLDKVKEDITLYIIMGTSLFLNQMAVSWFFLGIENFKYFAIRNIVFKIISIILIFATLKNPSDYLIYAFILSFSIFGANILDFTLAIRHAKLTITLSFIKHIKPTLIFFLAGIFSVLYSGIDIILLGLTDPSNPDKSVGLMSTSKRVVLLLLFLINALINVNYTRLSYLLSQGNLNEYNDTLKRTTNFITLISFLLFSIVFSFSKELLFIIGGKEFVEADLSLKILSLLLVTNILRNVLESQVLNPNGKEALVMSGNVVGWIATVISLLITIPLFSYNGASISVLIGDIINLLFFLYASMFVLKVNPFSKDTIIHLLLSVVIILIHTVLNPILSIKTERIIDTILYMGIPSFLYSTTYILLLGILKDKTVMSIFSQIKNVLKAK